MPQNASFWTALLIFQLVFGFTVFAITRDVYRTDANVRTSSAPVTATTSMKENGGVNWDEMLTFADNALATSGAPGSAELTDPRDISRMADTYFSTQEYDQAAVLYERLLGIDPQNVEIHNNLGITLQYLGRSDEARRWLQQGIDIDPSNQRIWLTLGYVASETGDTQTATEALTKATQLGSDESIRASAQRMLDALP
jgi:tetratricopeptide (TPR) repeat protein